MDPFPVTRQAQGGRGTMSNSSLETVSDHAVAPAFWPAHLLRADGPSHGPTFFWVCPCLSYQIHPKMFRLSWFHNCFLFLWLIMIYSWFIYIFVSWFVMVCVFLLVDSCLFSHVLSFSLLFWFPWDGRQGSTTVMLMLQTVSSPMAMSLPMPSTWTMDDWRRTKSWIYWEFTGNYWENPILKYGNPYYDRELRRIPWELFISFHGMNRCVLLLICVPYWMIIQYNHDESSFCLHGSGGINKFESGWQYPEAN